MKMLVLALLINLPDGGQVEVSRSVPMPAEDCIFLMRSVWQAPKNPTAFADSNGIYGRYDAACLPIEESK